MRALHTVFLFSAVFGGAAALSASCSPDYSDAAFRCDPSQGEDACPQPRGEDYICCSDDPAAAGGPLPAHPNLTASLGGDWGTPLFSGARNDLSRVGICFKGSKISDGVDTPSGKCPIPCNPQWNAEQTGQVCLTDPTTNVPGSCCQTVEVTERDCVFDGACWRPGNGSDIGNASLTGNAWGEGGTPWNRIFHDTNQDPGGSQCAALIAADPNVTDANCYSRLSMADQRGFCYAGTCPLDTDLSYQNACDKKNIAQGLAQCATNVVTQDPNTNPMDVVVVPPMPTSTSI